MNESRLRVIIADDHPVFRDGLARLIGELDGIDVVAVAANGLEVVELADQLAPHVVIMDLRMPELDGIEATRRITTAHPSIGVVVLTMFEEDELWLAAVRAGARGYLLKDSDEVEIATVLRGVAAARRSSDRARPAASSTTSAKDRRRWTSRSRIRSPN